MRIPNKLFKYEQSVLSHIPSILDILTSTQNNQIEIENLFLSVRNKVTVQDFVDVLDILFFVKKVQLVSIDGKTEVEYVKRD